MAVPTLEAGPPSPAVPRRRRRPAAERLAVVLPPDAVAGWLAPLGVTLFAFLLRLHRLAVPAKHAFDEVYYSCDAKMLLEYGYEHSHGAPEQCVAEGGAAYVVHPPLGKWMIAAGEKAFGYDSFGWRISAVVVGALSVLILARAGRRMFRSTMLGCVAGGLLALDGLHFVQSRVAMIDIFLMFFVVAAFACIVADRDVGRARLAARLGGDMSYPGPALGFRWWRLLAGVCCGAALGVKWSAVWYVAVLALLALAWEVGARRTAGVPAPFRAAVWREGLSLFVLFGVVTGFVYTASWAGWFLTDGGWRRDCEAAERPWEPQDECGPIRGFIAYHDQVLDFHRELESPHPYESSPWGWLLLARPVSYFYSSPEPGTSKEILGIGTPAIWWASIPALVLVAWYWVSRRDWRAAAILLGFAAGYLPWFVFPGRTMFLFYALPAVPFMCLAIAFACGIVLGRDDAPRPRRTYGGLAVAAYLTLVVVNFAYLYPVLSAKVLPYEQWRDRMWFSSWI